MRRSAALGDGASVQMDMATAIRTIGHEDRLSLVDHLDELRTRLIVSARRAGGRVRRLPVAEPRAAAHHQPAAEQADPEAGREGRRARSDRPRWPSRACSRWRADMQAIAATLGRARERAAGRHPRARCAAEIPRLRADVAKIPRVPAGQQAGDARRRRAVHDDAHGRASTSRCILSLPVILFELYGFVLPAFSPSERRVALPLLLGGPVPVRGRRAVRLLRRAAGGGALLSELQQQRVQRARAGRASTTSSPPRSCWRWVSSSRSRSRSSAPTRAGIVTPRQLRHNRRYAIVACAAIAAFLPGDAITLLLETVPLYLLYEASILLASFVERRERSTRTADTGSRARRRTAARRHRAEDGAKRATDHRPHRPRARADAVRPARPRPPPHGPGHLRRPGAADRRRASSASASAAASAAAGS